MESSSHLMYSEYMDTNETAHALNLLEGKKEKPSMVFTKSPVLARVMELIPRLKESEALKESESDMNIEVTNEDDPFIEMNVAIVEETDKNESVDVDVEESEDESDSEPSESQSVLDSLMDELEPMLDPSVGVILNNDTRQQAPVPRVIQESETALKSQNVLSSEIPKEDKPTSPKPRILEDPPIERLDNGGFIFGLWRPWL